MFTLPGLSYDYDALGKSISADIMRLHHDKHHQTYIDKLNSALADTSLVQNGTLEELETLLARLEDVPSHIRQAVRNNGGGHYNHSLFWQMMSPQGGGEPRGPLAAAITAKYGSFQAFVDAFTKEALGVFGSGWVWLQPDLAIVTSANQDTPINKGEAAPLLGLDVWEHAYYLDYKNKRDDYVAAWWDVVDWEFAEGRYRAH